jgi:hypothetical protein
VLPLQLFQLQSHRLHLLDPQLVGGLVEPIVDPVDLRNLLLDPVDLRYLLLDLVNLLL